MGGSIETLVNREYQYGFVTDIEADTIPPGLDEDTVRLISAKKDEPQWLLDWRLKAFRRWITMKEPHWSNVNYPPIDYQDVIYYSAPKPKKPLGSLDEVDPKLRETYDKLGISLNEQKRLTSVAVDACSTRCPSARRFKAELVEARHHLLLVRRGGARASRARAEVSRLRGAVLATTSSRRSTPPCSRDGSFVYVPKGVRCPMELSTYFRINAEGTGQFERTLIIADEGSYVSYLEGCTAPKRDDEPAARGGRGARRAQGCDDQVLDRAELVSPATRMARAASTTSSPSAASARARTSKISWTQVETGSAITWKYPSVILQGDNSVGEFYSRGGRQQPPAGRHGHEDDPHRPQHEVDHRARRASRPARATTAIAAR